MTALAKRELLRIGILVFAVLAFAWFPFGFSLMFVAGQQLLFGFDDFPLGPMVLSFGLGIFLALTGLIVVYRSLCRGGLRLPVIITVRAVVLSAISVPAARLMTRVEQERRYRQHTPKQITGANSRPASQFESRRLRRRVLVVGSRGRYHGGAAVAQFC
jgi:hypothetical protein